MMTCKITLQYQPEEGK